MKQTNGKESIWIKITIAAIIILIVASVLSVLVIKSDDHGAFVHSSKSSSGMLSDWSDNAEAKKALISYMDDITNESGPDYIPPERRIAVFDLDGTLFSETNPIYFDHSLLLHRVLEDEDYRDKASDFELDVAARILQWVQDGEYPKGMDTDHGKAIASAFSGMSVDDFLDYVEEYSKQEAPGYDGMTRGKSLYKPMMEIIDYLNANDFTCYIVSGTDRLIVRGALRNNINLPMGQIIGSDELIIAKGQGDTDGLSYLYDTNDELILAGEFLVKNLKMNKVSAIIREIGLQPVLSFGNSTGDSSMARYTTSNNPYKSLAFMLCCDDTEREYGNTSKAQKMYDLCAEEGWIPISMKNDFKTIYGDNVVKNPDKGLSIFDDWYEDLKYLLEEEEKAA